MVTVKKSYIKVIWRTIKGSLSRFLAIFAIVALGVGFLAGLLAATPDMRFTGDKYFDETNLFDIRVISTLGFSDKDVELFENYGGVKEVMPAQSADVFLQKQDGSTLVTRMHGIDYANLNVENPQNYINRIVLVEGALPKNKNECLVEKGTYGEEHVKVGDVLTISAENKDIEDVLQQESYTISGIVQSSYYFSFDREPSTIGSGTTNLFMYVDNSAFSRKAYSDIFLTLNGAAELNSLDSEYMKLRDDVIKNIEGASAQPIERRFTEVKTEANEKLADAKIEYADKKAEAEEKLADAAQELADAHIKLADGEKKIADGEKELADGVQKLADARVQIADGERALADGKEQFNTTFNAEKAKLEQAKKAYADAAKNLPEIESGIAQAKAGIEELNGAISLIKTQITTLEEALKGDPTNIDLQTQLATAKGTLAAYETEKSNAEETLLQLEAAKKQITEAAAAIKQGEAALQNGYNTAQTEFYYAQIKLDNAHKDLEKGEQDVAKATQELEDGKAELEDAKIKLADGQKEYDDAKTEADEKLADGQKQIDDAEIEIADLEKPEWFVLGRDTNMGFATFDSNISKVEAIAQVFPVFFFLVAALVALTTMTRMVEEERLQIGTVKALGYSKAAIAFKYSLYAFLASALGCAVGLAIGFNLFPRIIWNA